MSGTVAAGLALAGATVTVLDETGKAIATARPVTAAGAYGPIPLTGAGPFRVQACGMAADKALCVWGATMGGTLNLTPLTSAVAVLASGLPPEALMTGPVQGLGDTALASAHNQLRAALAPALIDAGLASDFDLLTGPLTPGSHSGYDRLLDTVDVGLGVDSRAWVSLGSVLGGGWAYLEPGTTSGSLVVNPAAAGVDHAGIDTLFKALGAVMPFTAKCSIPTTGLKPLLDANVRASADFLVAAFANTDQATQVLCGHMAGVLAGDTESLEKSTLLPALPTRCDFSGADPVCRVKLIFQTAAPAANAPAPVTPKDVLRQFGIDQVIVKRAGTWLLMGNRLEVQASAAARLVLARRVDQTATDVYSRFLDIRIPAWPGLACARASQKDTAGADVPLALFKPASGATYLSVWSLAANDPTPSLNAAVGTTRGADIVAVPVPVNAAGDTTARHFARAGRALKIELFSNTGCSTPLAGADGGVVSIDLAGQLPITAAHMASQSWPVLASASAAALVSLKGAVNAKLNFGPVWSAARGDLAMTRAQLCSLDANCGNRLAATDLPSAATAAAFSPTLGSPALLGSDYKLLRLTGRTPSGLVLQLDAASCTAQASGLGC